MAWKKKFISIIWGYHAQIFSFDKKQNYHLLPFEVMLAKGYECELYAIDSQVRIEDDPSFPKGVKVIYYSGVFDYLKYLWDNRDAFVYVNSLTLGTLATGLILKRSIFMAHDQTLPLVTKRIKRLITLFFYRFFTKIRTINQGESELLDYYGIPNFVLPLPISKGFYEPNESIRKDIVFIGNLTHDKNPECILEGLEILRKRYPEIVLHIFGEDRYLNMEWKTYGQLISERGLDDAVDMHWFQPHDIIKSFLKDALVFVNASVSEGQCLAVFEAALAGCALCLPPILSFPSVFEDDALYHSNGQDLADNIVYYLENPNERSGRVKRIQDMILNKYDYDYLRKKMDQFFNL